MTLAPGEQKAKYLGGILTYCWKKTKTKRFFEKNMRNEVPKNFEFWAEKLIHLLSKEFGKLFTS
jgi:hypothetical protein